ncbi:MAG: DUF86 domain-containing protein [Deinococcus sp.]|nr:DUF86 domain-containing protein [Deinococcus sp.]
MKDDQLYLLHIAQCIQRIESYTQDGRAAFMASSLTQDAVIRNLEIIGEATKRISQDLKQAYPDVPWRRVAGLRDVLIHNYIRVDLDEVWNVMEADLPGLKSKIEAILQELGAPPRSPPGS